MTKRKKPSAGSYRGTAVTRKVAWALLAGLWLLLVTSLASFDPADPPTHAYGVMNEPAQNWIGRVGALIAYKIHLVVGPGAWVGLLWAAIFLGIAAIGRRVNQLALRAVGVVLMTISASSMASAAIPILAPGLHSAPEGSGGLVALFINDQLTSRFNVPGTMAILLLAFWVGAILTADRWVMALATALGQTVMRTADLIPARVPRPPFATWLSGLWARRWRSSGTLGPRGTIPVRSAQVTRNNQGETEDGRGEADIAAGAPGAYPAEKGNLSPDQLRAKIKKLPINIAPRTRTREAGPPRELDLSGYEFPSLSLLEEPETNFTSEMEQIVRDQALRLEGALGQYRIEGEVVGIDSGPVITLFELRLAPGTKVAAISAVSSDLARALKAQNIRIVPNMAGKDTVGIEVPNLKKERVSLKELMTAMPQAASKMRLPMFLGKDASGNPLIQDLASMPHALIAGTTGSGKSVCINAIIMSFLFTRRPDELKLILVDPKMVEMSMFKDIPHLMCPVVTEVSKAAAILEWAVTKMDERYELLAEAGVRDIARYNALSWDDLIERMQPQTDKERARIPRKLPYMVFIVDELADMMMTNKEIEGSIVRIAQKARAVGIHMILATQRPQANVVTGLIKSNMPARVSFKVASGMDSRIVLDQKGGEVLLGQGDMLYLSPRSSRLTRAQGTLVDDIEIRRTVNFLNLKAPPTFEPQLMQFRSGGSLESGQEEDRDPLFEQAVRIVLESQRGSVSLLQRRLTIGYSRASRLVEQMAEAGIIGDYKGSQAREVTISLEEWEAMKAQAEADAQAAEPVEDLDGEADEEYEEDVVDQEQAESIGGDADDPSGELLEGDEEDEYDQTVEEEAEDPVLDGSAGAPQR